MGISATGCPMERRQNARAFVKQWQADPVLPFSADVPPAAVGKRDKPPSLFRCGGGVPRHRTPRKCYPCSRSICDLCSRFIPRRGAVLQAGEIEVQRNGQGAWRRNVVETPEPQHLKAWRLFPPYCTRRRTKRRPPLPAGRVAFTCCCVPSSLMRLSTTPVVNHSVRSSLHST